MGNKIKLEKGIYHLKRYFHVQDKNILLEISSNKNCWKTLICDSASCL